MTFDLAVTTPQSTVSSGTDRAVVFENLHGGAGNDVLKGNASDNAILGGAGDDDLAGAGGNDTLDGGGGVDRCGRTRQRHLDRLRDGDRIPLMGTGVQV